MAEEGVTVEICKLHREIMDGKIEVLKVKDEALDGRMQGIEQGIKEVHDLQKLILYAIIGIAVGVILTLIGVILGRGIDFGWILLHLTGMAV